MVLLMWHLTGVQKLLWKLANPLVQLTQKQAEQLMTLQVLPWLLPLLVVVTMHLMALCLQSSKVLSLQLGLALPVLL